MSFRLMVLVVSLLLAVAGGCKSSSTTPATSNTSQAGPDESAPSAASQAPPMAGTEPATKAKVDACALLTSNEIQTIQGEAIKETKLSGHSSSGFSVSQCFFTLPTFTNSVSLLLAQRGEGAAAQDPKDFWRNTFHADKDAENDKGRERDRDKKGRGEEEEESSPPQKVSGIGDEAYWTGSRVGGALYVLKGNAYIRISLGGPGNQADKVKKSKNLAQKVLERL